MLEIHNIDLGYIEYRLSKDSVIITNKVGDGLAATITKCMIGNLYCYILTVESSIHSYSIKQKYLTETPVDMEVRARYNSDVNIVFNDNTNNTSISFKYSKKMYIPSAAVDPDPMNIHSYGDMINDFTNRHNTSMTAQ